MKSNVSHSSSMKRPDEETEMKNHEEGKTQQRRNTNYTKKAKPNKEETQTNK